MGSEMCIRDRPGQFSNTTVGAYDILDATGLPGKDGVGDLFIDFGPVPAADTLMSGSYHVVGSGFVADGITSTPPSSQGVYGIGVYVHGQLVNTEVMPILDFPLNQGDRIGIGVPGALLKRGFPCSVSAVIVTAGGTYTFTVKVDSLGSVSWVNADVSLLKKNEMASALVSLPVPSAVPSAGVPVTGLQSLPVYGMTLGNWVGRWGGWSPDGSTGNLKFDLGPAQGQLVVDKVEVSYDAIKNADVITGWSSAAPNLFVAQLFVDGQARLRAYTQSAGLVVSAGQNMAVAINGSAINPLPHFYRITLYTSLGPLTYTTPKYTI